MEEDHLNIKMDAALFLLLTYFGNIWFENNKVKNQPKGMAVLKKSKHDSAISVLLILADENYFRAHLKVCFSTLIFLLGRWTLSFVKENFTDETFGRTTSYFKSIQRFFNRVFKHTKNWKELVWIQTSKFFKCGVKSNLKIFPKCFKTKLGC